MFWPETQPRSRRPASNALNSGGYGPWLFGIVDAPFCANSGVSTKPGQLHMRLGRVGMLPASRLGVY